MNESRRVCGARANQSVSSHTAEIEVVIQIILIPENYVVRLFLEPYYRCARTLKGRK